MTRFLAVPFEWIIVLALSLILAAPPNVFAQDHVVSPAQIQKDLAASSAARQENQQQIEQFLSSAEARRAMSSAHINYEQVTAAVSMLSDAQMAELAARSTQAQKDFAAGDLDNHDLLLILVGIAALILIIVAVR